MAIWVRATTSGMWSTIDLLDRDGYKYAEKILVMCMEQGRWCVDGRAVDVQHGLCVSFKNAEDANWFCSQRRGTRVAVEPDVAVPFESEADAMFFVNAGLGDRMSNREVDDFIARQRAEIEAQHAPEIEEEEIEPVPRLTTAKKRRKAA